MGLRNLGVQQNTSAYTGHLVKKVRKSMGLRQYQIVNDQITRNLVSLVENNKIPLTANAASIIVTCINAHAEEKGSPIRITEQDLRVEGIYEARVKIASYLETFDNIENEGKATIEFMIHDINVLFSQYDLPESKALLFGRIGLYFLDLQDYSSAIVYLLKAYEATVRVSDTEQILTSLSDLVKVYLLNGEYASAVRYAKIAENIAPISSTTKFQAILFNKALAFKHKGDYKRTVWEIDRMIKTWPLMPVSKQFDLKLLKAITLKNMERFDEANELLISLLDFSDKDIDRAKVLANLLHLYTTCKDAKLLNSPIKELKTLIPGIKDHKEYIGNIYMDLSAALVMVQDYPEAKHFFAEGFDAGVEISDFEMPKNALNLLMAESFKLVMNPEEIFEYLKRLLETELLKPDTEQIITMIRYFNQMRMPEHLENLLVLLAPKA